MSEIEKLEYKRSELAKELELLQADIDAQTAALGSALLESKSIERGAAALQASQARCSVLLAAIAQADTKLREMREAQAAQERAAAIKAAQALDDDGARELARFIAAVIMAEKSGEALDALYSKQSKTLNSVSDAPHLELGSLRSWIDYPTNGRAYRSMLLRQIEESRPDIMSKAREMAK